ncbi:MAG: response regulator [Sulfuritalea sp.]|jgi:response regulator RpfG family c-di-GMP phosphodiesterase|nr:response regulator [Sulfuritalea sp.]MBP6637110.1 response regulator [Sulfuritalea sp.]MBP7422053.1 response regulator [Sulfuritalea sp.]
MSTLLVVDDNATNLTLFRHLLQKIEDAEVLCFAEAARALEWCAANEPDLILLDYMMPVIDGLEFIRRLQAMPERRDVAIVMVTADTESDVRHQALSLGAQDFLTKPVDKVELIARVRNLLALRLSRRQLADRAAWLADEVAKATATIAAREKEAILRLSRAAEYRDPETGMHLLRMSNYTRIVAAGLGLPPGEQKQLMEAAPMHDVGKVGTPDHILLKPGRLTPEEFEVMKQHATIGYEILRDSVSQLLQNAAVVALTHHEKFDGSGYPRGLAGEAIPLYGRIVAVADVFDALTSERPYKKAWTLDAAATFLKEGAGSHFDPACVEAFLGNWGEVIEIRARYGDADDAAADADLARAA